MITFSILGILTNIKKESEEKVESSEAGSGTAAAASCDTMSFPSGHDPDGLHYRVQGTFTRYTKNPYLQRTQEHLMNIFFMHLFRFLDDNQLSPGTNGSSMMNPSGGNNGTTSWLFSSPNPGGGFHTPDHLHGGHPAGPPPPPSTSAYEDGRGGTPMIPFSQGELSFVDTLTIHPTVNQQAQKNDQGQNQHFVTSSTLHPGSTLSVVEAVEQAGNFGHFSRFFGSFWKELSGNTLWPLFFRPTQSNVCHEITDWRFQTWLLSLQFSAKYRNSALGSANQLFKRERFRKPRFSFSSSAPYISQRRAYLVQRHESTTTTVTLSFYSNRQWSTTAAATTTRPATTAESRWYSNRTNFGRLQPEYIKGPWNTIPSKFTMSARLFECTPFHHRILFLY